MNEPITFVNAEMEHGLLAAVSQDASCWDAVSGLVDERSFTGVVRPRLWNVIARLYHEKQPVEPLTVIAAAREDGMRDDTIAEEVGAWTGGSTVASLVSRYARTLRDLALMRQARALAESFRGLPPGKAADKISRLQRALAAIDFGSASGIITLGDLVEDLGRDLEAEARGDHGTERISTGFAALDKVTQGLMPGIMHVYAGRPGQGKSALATGMLTALGRAGVPTGVFWLEDIARLLALRAVAHVSAVPANAMLHGKNMSVDGQRAWWDAFEKARFEIGKWPIYPVCSMGMTGSDITQHMRRLAREKGVRVFLTDHFGRVRVEGGERSDMELGAVAQEYLEEAATLGACPVGFHQLGRRGDGSGDPSLNWLFNSDYLGQHARVVGYVSHHDDRFKISMVKVTYGEADVHVLLGWDGVHMRVYEPTPVLLAKWANEDAPKSRTVKPVPQQQHHTEAEPEQRELPHG